MGRVVLGIHGLANKPMREELESWWRQSILEGLANIQAAHTDLDYRAVYWADLLYKQQQHNDEDFGFDALYNTEPYRKAKPGELVEYREGFGSWLRAAALDVGGTGLDVMKRHLGMSRFADWALGKIAKDLAFYYDDSRQILDRDQTKRRAKEVLRDELKAAIREEHAKGSEIMVVAHSMGSIIAYDALRDIGNEDGNNVAVPHFITIGSPLGLPHVKGKIIEERGYDPRVRTPSIVTQSWTNFADRKDPVALDSRLRDDYAANRHDVRVRDDEVANDYHTGEGDSRDENHHKSYGYLRTPEVSKCIAQFLAGDGPSN